VYLTGKTEKGMGTRLRRRPRRRPAGPRRRCPRPPAHRDKLGQILDWHLAFIATRARYMVYKLSAPSRRTVFATRRRPPASATTSRPGTYSDPSLSPSCLPCTKCNYGITKPCTPKENTVCKPPPKPGPL